MSAKIDIHNYSRILDRAIDRVNESKDLSARNKKLILDFRNVLILERMSKARQLKYVDDIRRFLVLYLKKDADKATDKEIQKAILAIEQIDTFSPWTKHGYKVIVRKFWKWIAYGDECLTRKDYPRSVSWITPNIKKRDQPKVKASDLLSEDEAHRLIESADTTRDRAILSLLYELGARIGEIGNLKIKDVTRHKYGFLIDLYGKTGHRTPLVVMSTLHLSTWLASHPDSKNPDAPLWVSLIAGKRGKALSYGSFHQILARSLERAGIKKRVYPHLFRHSRVTHLLSSGKMNEAQAKVYFGWVPESKMLSEYSHLVCGDVHKAILAIHGIEDSEEKASSSVRCVVCSNVNPARSSLCLRCGSTFSVADPEGVEEEIKERMEAFITDPSVHDFFMRKYGDFDARKAALEKRR